MLAVLRFLSFRVLTPLIGRYSFRHSLSGSTTNGAYIWLAAWMSIDVAVQNLIGQPGWLEYLMAFAAPVILIKLNTPPPLLAAIAGLYIGRALVSALIGMAGYLGLAPLYLGTLMVLFQLWVVGMTAWLALTYWRTPKREMPPPSLLLW